MCYLFAILCSCYISMTLTSSISELFGYTLDESPGPTCIWSIDDTWITNVLQRKLVFIQSCGGSACWHCSTWIWWIIWSCGWRDTDRCVIFQQWHIFLLFMYKMECFGLGRNRLFHWMLWLGNHWTKTNHAFRPGTQTWNNHTTDLLFFFTFLEEL